MQGMFFLGYWEASHDFDYLSSLVSRRKALCFGVLMCIHNVNFSYDQKPFFGFYLKIYFSKSPKCMPNPKDLCHLW